MHATPIYCNLTNNTIISTHKFERIQRNGYLLLIVPKLGAWATISDDNKDILDVLSTPKTIMELKRYNNKKIGEIIDELFYSGIIKINNKDIYCINQNKAEKARENKVFMLVLKYTNACNLKCSYCYAYEKHEKKTKKLSNEYVYQAIRLIDPKETDSRLCVCFHGGEPLTRFEDIKECVQTIKKEWENNVEFAIQTNGTLITPKIAKYLWHERFSVGISIDGFDEETNKLRPFVNNRSSINATLKSIKYCIDAGFVPGIISVMTNNIQNRAVDIIDKLAQIGIKSFHFNHFFPSGRSQNKGKDFSVSINDLLNTRLKILLYINDYNAQRNIEDHIQERYTCNIIRRLTQVENIPYMCAQSPCGAGKKMLSMFYNGDLYPCDDFGNDSLFKIGNISDIHNMTKYLAQSNVVKLCQSHNINNIPKCCNCTYRNICISHCASDSYHFYGKLNEPHSACDFIQQFIPQVIDLLYIGRIQVENLIV